MHREHLTKRDHNLFYEYFHGDNGVGLGASHHTGCTGVVATPIHLFRILDSERALEFGKTAVFRESAGAD
jgi:hypothetical protein